MLLVTHRADDEFAARFLCRVGFIDFEGVRNRPWWREVRDILRTEIRGHGGSTAEPPPEINSRTQRSNVVEDEVETPGYVLLNTGGHANETRSASFRAVFPSRVDKSARSPDEHC
jgi:hypothetical protein